MTIIFWIKIVKIKNIQYMVKIRSKGGNDRKHKNTK